MPFSRFIARQLSRPSGLVGLYLAPLWNRRNRALNDAAFAALAPQPADRVLEVGFGGGYLLGRLAAAVTQGSLAGIDVSPAMVAYGRRRYGALIRAGRLELQCAAAESLPYPAGLFTDVCSVNSLFYWHDVPQALAECRRVLAAGGQLVLCFTGRSSLAGKGFARHGVALYEESDVRQMMAEAGFRDIRAQRAADRHREFLCMTGTC